MGGAVQVVVTLLRVLAVVTLVACESEDPFFEDGIAAVPQRDGEADVLVTIAGAGQAILVQR